MAGKKGQGIRHGMYGTPTYKSWQKMLERCRSPKNNRFAEYGGRGITVCPEWHSFEGFFKDMGPRPDGTSIDRRDVNGHYCKSNCMWSDKKTQARNKRNVMQITVDGVRKPLPEWAELIGIGVGTLRQRIHKYGMTPEQAVKHIKYSGNGFWGHK